MADLITLDTNGDIETHIHGVVSDYGTLCCIAIDGDSDSGIVIEATGKKVDCEACINMWKSVTQVKKSQIKLIR
ncbi:MAG: hypothetical protein COA78_06750 [Blastopirellula sp.]|nr:MAG: hypothetical protein COA78_06750 [Blastopirellula sp.]